MHNYNVVPTKKRDVLVHGSYQSGISVVDFSDLSNIREVGYADPEAARPDAAQRSAATGRRTTTTG